MTLYFSDIFLMRSLDDHVIAFGVRTEFFGVALHDLFIETELPEFLVSFLVCHIFNEVIAHWF